MVTSNKMPDKKVVKMADQSIGVVVPQRTLLGEVNEHITCPLCHGYYIDATTIVECLHSFCRSCIIKHLQVKSYCPVCEMMINSARPNIKLDKALQDIVYKLVPGLFQKEMERRQQFYASRPGPAASATPEQRGEDTERIIFSPEDVISFSLEYADVTDTDSISSKSSDSNEPQPVSATTRRYLQCPAVVNISHLKKFLCMKFDIDSSQFAIDILYKRVPLPDYYTLMDIAYIYNWKRNEPMRFFYQITDYIAIRNRFFDINRKSSHFRDSKSSPTPTEDTNVSSPAQNLNDHGSEVSSGTDSPMPDDNNLKKTNDTLKKNEKTVQKNKDSNNQDSTDDNKKATPTQSKKSDDDVEKSQFLNSFELTAKNNCTQLKTSPIKPNVNDKVMLSNDSTSKIQTNISKTEDSLKRKHHSVPNMPEMKKLKIELEKTNFTNILNNSTHVESLSSTNQNGKSIDHPPTKPRDTEGLSKSSPTLATTNSASIISSTAVKEIKQQQTTTVKQQVTETPGLKRNVPVSQNVASPKRKPVNDTLNSMQPPSSTQRTVSPLKLQVPKSDGQFPSSKATDLQKPAVKKMPDLKPSIPSQTSQNKGQQINKVRMDLLANNSDPTIDRSKILSQVKSSLGVQSGTAQTSGDPLKSLFDSCKINIPSSLSITLTDQKLDPRNPGEATNVEQKKNMLNKNLTAASNVVTHKVPSPPVHNYIEILKLPDNDPKKQNKMENNADIKVNPSHNKTETSTSQQKTPSKSSETSTKGPIPNLKPIADTKLGKQNTNFSAPITFQQTFEQQVQSMQCDKKSKLPKNKAQVPKLVPATPKAFSTCKFNNNSNKSTPTNTLTAENKTSIALDLSTPHNIQSQLGPQQTKAFETMQSIANLAKKQNLTSKGLPLTMSQSNVFSSISNRPLITGVSPLRVPTTSSINQMKLDKTNSNGSQINNLRSEMPNKANQMKPMHNAATTLSSPGYQITHNSPCATQPSPRPQTRSPSSSPKLVIAEEKQAGTSSTEQNINQSNQITSTQIPNVNIPKNVSPKESPGPSKTVKTLTPAGKITGIRQPITPTMKSNPTLNTAAEYLSQPQFISAHALLTQQMLEMHWLKTQRQYDMYKNMTNSAHQAHNDFNSKDKQ